MMLHTKYQGSRSHGSDKKIFSCFPYISLCKTCDPLVRHAYNLNKLGRGPLGDATYQI